MGKKIPVIDGKKVHSFWESRAKLTDPETSTHFHKDDCHTFDLALIREHLPENASVLDLACGTGRHLNELADEVSLIKGVDKYSSFLEFIPESLNVETESCDILTYKDTKKYDLILLLGIMNYFNEKESRQIYRTVGSLLKESGVVIVKHACGVQEDVLIDNYSQALGQHYHALYRHLPSEQALLKEFFHMETVDIYPKRLNPWKNTHYYAFVCRPPNA